MTTEASLEVEVNENEQPKVQNEQVGTSIEQDQQGEEITAEKNESPENKNPEETATKSPSSPSSVGERSPGKQKKEREASEGKGISRFLPPWLKKQKSQSFSEPKEDDGKSKAEETVEPAKEDDSEGVKSGEDQPVETKLEEKEEKRSVSSAETQPAKEENKEEETQNVVEDKVENEGDVGKEEHVPKPAEPKKEIPLKSPKKLKTVPCKVTLLDGTEYSCDLEKRAKGQVLFVKVCDHLNLLETDYFGLTYRDNADQKNWLDPAKEIKRQIRSSPWLFSFNVKFYPPDPSQLTEDITRYFLCLQLRQDIASGRLPCSFVTHALLGSYTLQAELGDYDAEEHSIDYISDFQFAPNQTKEMEDKVMELHKTHRGLTPAQADIQFLENAKKLSMYGVDLHHAKDSEAVDIMLGVCANGLLIYKDRLRINRFAWPKILKISYKRSNFYIKVRPGELEQFESTIGFKLPNHRAAKRLWKVCVEHHTFYRLSSPEQPPKARFLTLGSKFRYSGRTQAQTREASTRIDRPAPYFERTSSKRVSRSLDGAPIGTISDQSLLKEPQVIEAGSAVDGRILSTEAFVQESMNGASSPESEEAQLKDTKSKSLRIEGANIYVRHSNLMLEDLDKSQDELLKHQASISELKRSFMESTPEPRPNEWEKRCITPLSLQTHGKLLPRTRGMRTGLSDALESSDEIQNIVEVKKQSECDNKETPLTEHIKTEENKEVDFPREANGEVQEVKQLDKKETDSVSSSDSSSDSENEEAEYQAQSRLSESVLREELEESAEDIQESQPEDESNVILVEDHTMTVKVTHSEEMTTLMTQEITYKVGENVFTEGHEAVEEEHNKINGDLSPVDEASAQIICCSEPPVVKTEMVTISDATQRTEISTKEVPIVQTETKTITFESPQLDGTRDGEPGVLLSAQTITSDSILTTTTTHITKTGKGGISETRIEKRIVISGDADIDHDEALAQAIKEAKEQHPDMSITRVVVHKETEVTEEGED
ncbi:band 4.1-like protein 2 isoform X1 [Spea bombifrons]|uniref:band 4.1-like protein 2 isoform X1 n=1 Tax=Spea bombifrons TaxID=233779 RepID=UPI00234B2A55|nr:band 4.1-like protein 2 isoform X1 [Spea bombifrons]XP_053315219.1 band 4.1-like protein 2 isoform X1 [Spea bombifrons]